MLTIKEIQSRFALNYDSATHRRIIGNKEVVIHCHHYHARLQQIIEESKQIQGKEMVLAVTETVFADYLQQLLLPTDSPTDKWQLVKAFYSHLGYGYLDFSQLEQGIITATSSHFVQGWLAGFKERREPVCTFTQGYLQAAIYLITGETVFVHETACMVTGVANCRFLIDKQRQIPIQPNNKFPINFSPKTLYHPLPNNTIDTKELIKNLIKLPIYGNEQGLIPLCGVYLANTPIDFYNLLMIRFLEKMSEKQLFKIAKRLLIDAAECCAINTFGGLLHSIEWQQLVEPMVKEPQDRIVALVAFCNALGWGNIYITEHSPANSLTLEALNSYEALGCREYHQPVREPYCFMLTGVAAGIMALIYSEGTLQEKFGTYFAEETQCLCCHDTSCLFHAEKI